MQLGEKKRRSRRPRRIAASLAVATASLLHSEPGSAADVEGKNWFFDAGVLYFGEKDRVEDLSASAIARRLFSRGRSLSFRLVYDSLTGASANGAVPAKTPQTFTSASGGKGYTAPAGETPLDTTFHDARGALDVNWSQPIGRRSRTDLGFSFSSESDYLSTGLKATFSRDFNQHNTTLSAGLGLARDTINPLGGVPVPFALMQPPSHEGDENDLGGKSPYGESLAGTIPPPAGKSHAGGTETKTVTDVLLGVTQVLSPRTIVMFNYSWSRSEGYLTDPYKILSVVDPVTGDPLPAAGGTMNTYLFESRPETRTKQGFYTEIRHHLSHDMIGGSYRFMTDDWGIRSHTFGLSYRWDRGRFYIEPQARWYTQSAATFYRRVLFAGDRIPQHATADYRLGEMDALTLGIKYGIPLDENREWNVRLEYYNQSGTSPPEASVGSLRDFDLFPSVSSLILQVGYSF